MPGLIFPDNIKGHVTAFFTGKNPGADTEEIGRILGIERERIYLPVQKHTDKVIVVESMIEPKVGDAVLTREMGILVGVQVADCVPILLYEKSRGIVGAVHAGWRGTAAGILKKTIRAALDRFAGDPGEIVIAVGPSIRWCCYGVDGDVLGAVRKETGDGDYYLRKGEKYCLDLATANKHQAISVGVPERNIWLSEDCTYCRPEAYYSYRYARGSTGRQGGFIGRIFKG